VWDGLNDPHKRSEWMEGTHWSAGERPGGRMAVGARNHNMAELARAEMARQEAPEEGVR
jgi:hypothetical protein